MALFYLIVALVIQGTVTFANVNNTEAATDCEPNTVISEIDDEVIKDFRNAGKDWIDFFLLPDTPIFPSSSVAMMSQATNSDKPIEEQLEEIKDIAEKITKAIQHEMSSLLAFAMTTYDHDKEKVDMNNHITKRSVETPMASTQLINRLLKHIKSNNEFQNIAIDKMMTAQEIADKYGIEFRPDTEIVSDLAFAANQQAKEMASLLQDTLEMRNVTEKQDQPDQKEQEKACAYTQHKSEQEPQAHHSHSAHPVVNHHHHPDSYPSYNYYYNYPYETQIPAPVNNYYSPPVSQRPNFYDALPYASDYYPYCTVEPVTTSTTLVLPFEEVIEPEPELVAEEFEEAVSSKMFVERGDEPGSATVNHVMTYTVAEKSHFKTPEIEKLPQQMQYCFFLM